MKLFILINILFSAAILVGGDFLKKDWKNNFKTRDEFVAHLREQKKQSVRSWVLEKAQDEEENALMTQSILKDYISKFPRFDSHINKSNSVKICCEFENCDKTLINAVIGEFSQVGYPIRLTIRSSSKCTGIIDDKNSTILEIDFSDSSLTTLAHEAGHCALSHPQKRAYVYWMNRLFDFNIKIQEKNISRFIRQCEFSADSFAASRSIKYAQEEMKHQNELKHSSSLTHPSSNDRYKNVKEICKLLQVERKWLMFRKFLNFAKKSSDQFA